MTTPVKMEPATFVDDPRLRRLLEAIRENLEILCRDRGNIEESALRVQDLLNVGVIGVENSTLYRRVIEPEVTPLQRRYDSRPTAPEWSTIVRNPTSLQLQWILPNYTGLANTELWEGSTTTLADSERESTIAAPTIVASVNTAYSAAEYFWMRCIATSGSAGTFSPLAGSIIVTIDASAGLAVGNHAFSAGLPDNAIVTDAEIEVTSAFTSSSSTAKCAVGIATDDAAGIYAQKVITDSAWDVGTHDCIQDGTTGNHSEETTAARDIELEVAVEALTGGEATLRLAYMVTE